MENSEVYLEEVMTAVMSMQGSIQFLSQRVAWSESCFSQVKDSGVMEMSEMLRKVMEDHDKLKSQISMLAMRLVALHGEGESSSQGGMATSTARPLKPKFGN